MSAALPPDKVRVAASAIPATAIRNSPKSRSCQSVRRTFIASLASQVSISSFALDAGFADDVAPALCRVLQPGRHRIWGAGADFAALFGDLGFEFWCLQNLADLGTEPCNHCRRRTA